jgi:hypothetical protein
VPRRMTGITKNGENSPKNLFNQSFSISFWKNMIFLLLALFFVPSNHIFCLFLSFFQNQNPVFLMNGLRHHWFNNLNRLPICITTLIMFWRCGQIIFPHFGWGLFTNISGVFLSCTWKIIKHINLLYWGF